MKQRGPGRSWISALKGRTGIAQGNALIFAHISRAFALAPLGAWDGSPRRKPWVPSFHPVAAPLGAAERRGPGFYRPQRGWVGVLSVYPRLTPWATISLPLTGLEHVGKDEGGALGYHITPPWG